MINDRLYFALVYLVEALIAWQYFSAIAERRTRKGRTFLIFFIGYGAASLVFQVSASIAWINTSIFTIVNFSILLLCYSCSWRRAVFHSVLLSCIMTLSELLILFPLGIIFDDFTLYLSSDVVRIILFIMSKLTYLIAAKVCAAITMRRQKRKPNTKAVYLFLGSFFVSSLLLLLFLYYLSVTVDMTPRAAGIMIVCSILFFVSNILVFVAYQYVQNLNKEYLSLELMRQKGKSDREYYKLLKEHYEDQRVLIHDIRNHLEILRQIADKQQDLESIKYITELEEMPALRKKMVYCENSVLNAILVHYAGICEERNILFCANIGNGTTDFMDGSDVTALLGNLLSNAVEASEASERAEIDLSIEIRQPQKVFALILTNTCGISPTEGKDGKYITQKTDNEHHGIGLKSVQRVMKKYHGFIQQYYDPDAHTFHTTLMIPAEN